MKIPPPKQRHGANSNHEPPQAQDAEPEHRLSAGTLSIFWTFR
jgi:hypothetical protein